MSVLVDSSVWIAAAHPKNQECLALQRLIRKNELIHVIRPVQVEVCQGARSPEEFHKLWDAFLGFSFLEVNDAHWGKAAWNFFTCRKRGITLSTLDCLIGTIAAEYRVPLWSVDRIFEKAQPVLKFDLFQ